MSKLGKTKTSVFLRILAIVTSVFAVGIFVWGMSLGGLGVGDTRADFKPKDGERGIEVVSVYKDLDQQISTKVLTDAVNSSEKLPEGVKTLINDGATKMDNSRIYLTPESVAKFLGSNEGLEELKEKATSEGSPVLLEIPLEPDNPDSPIFWLYYEENDGFYISHLELPGDNIWDEIYQPLKNHEEEVKTGSDLVAVGMVSCLVPVFFVGMARRFDDNERFKRDRR